MAADLRVDSLVETVVPMVRDVVPFVKACPVGSVVAEELLVPVRRPDPVVVVDTPVVVLVKIAVRPVVEVVVPTIRETTKVILADTTADTEP